MARIRRSHSQARVDKAKEGNGIIIPCLFRAQFCKMNSHLLDRLDSTNVQVIVKAKLLSQVKQGPFIFQKSFWRSAE